MMAAGEPLKIKIKLDEGVSLPEKHGMWYDLAAAEDYDLKAGEIKIISLGCRIKPPEGYYALVASRSSTPLKYGLIIANGLGIIEYTYCGNDDVLGLVVYATRDVHIDKGTRLAQFTLTRWQLPFTFEQVDDMGYKSRGGYGSTGV